jgi:hypothetical protein
VGDGFDWVELFLDVDVFLDELRPIVEASSATIRGYGVGSGRLVDCSLGSIGDFIRITVLFP